MIISILFGHFNFFKFTCFVLLVAKRSQNGYHYVHLTIHTDTLGGLKGPLHDWYFIQMLMP